MPTLVIRNLDDDLHVRLKAQAAVHRRSMEEEARLLLRRGVAVSPMPAPQSFGAAMRAIFEPLGGLELPEPERQPAPEPIDFSSPEWDRST